MRYRIQVELISTIKIPSCYLKPIPKIAHTTISYIPKSILKKYLSPRTNWTINVAIVGTVRMKKTNYQFRKKNRTTDVLSFSNIESFNPVSNQIGEVILCWPVLKKQAVEYGGTIDEEITRLLVHGILHLFGYDHEKNKQEELKMFRLQNKICNKLS